jgi:GTP-binding protein
MDYIDEARQLEDAEPELLERAEQRRLTIQAEARDRIEDLAVARRRSRQQVSDDDDDDDDDDHDVEIVYAE